MSGTEDRGRAPRRPHFLTTDPHVRLCAALAALLGAEVARSERSDWCSATFAGSRHRVALRTGAGPDALAALPEHEFQLPGVFVADLGVTGAEDGLVTVEALLVEE